MSPPESAAGPVLIVAALPEEVVPLRKRLQHRRRLQARIGRARLRRWTGHLGGEMVQVAVSGDGALRAREGIEALLDAGGRAARRPRHLLVIGVAGGIDPRLEVGSVVVAEEVCHEEGAVYRAAPGVAAHAAALTGGMPGRVVTGPRLADTVSRKQALAARWGRDLPAVFDLETAWYVEAADHHGIPWTVLRAVSDRAGDALPRFLEGCRTADGAIDRRRVAIQALRHPGAIPEVLRLAGRVRACGRVLATAAEKVILGAREISDPSEAGMASATYAAEDYG